MLAMEGEGRDGYRDQIVTCDVGVSLHSKTHPLFMQYGDGTGAPVLCTKLVSCAFSPIPICPLLIQRIFHSLVYIYIHVVVSVDHVMLYVCVPVSATGCLCSLRRPRRWAARCLLWPN